jgi:hypothetical protein
MSDEKRDRDFYRRKALASQKRRSALVTVECDGEPLEFELRVPTIAEDSRIRQRCTSAVPDPKAPGGARVDVDVGTMALLFVIKCAFVPGEDARVFEEADLETLRNAPEGGWIEKLAKEVNKFRSPPDPEEIAKNSETPLSNS